MDSRRRTGRLGPTFTFEAREAGIYFLVFRVETPNGKAEEVRIEGEPAAAPEISFPVGDDRVMEVEAGRETVIAPDRQRRRSAFEWTLDGEKAGTDATYTFKQSDLRDYQLTLRAENEDGEDEASVTVRVVERFTVTAVFPAPSLRFGKEGT